MNITKTKTFNATITLGLEVGYSEELYNKEYLLNELQAYQKLRIDEVGIYLSASISECDIVLSGQIEKHLKLEFINYPKFPLELEVFKKEILELGSYLLNRMKQNRTVIVFSDETIMLEIDEAIDPRI
ncbi:hypothetical protein SAMN05443667_105250 [Flavobacterium gillisiae]|uniref:Uncharacterized protein n=1 Tax=Flavobacterium gillisiae TaxID=150146 RepID=A0A1H4C6T1_9FLAO|nr:hypothetical protein [Flavobacterium gillisiae]SEA56094.1 hypothetical protein SAMN05443667_105250 [Flavobacterium gillisiae]